MKRSNFVTILASIALSIAAAIFISHRQSARDEIRVRTRSIEIIDARGNSRAVVGTMNIGGREEPQITLLDPDGHPAVVLSVNAKSGGVLYFNSPDREANVAVGHLSGSDVASKLGPDPLGIWGIKVIGRNGQAVALGIGNDGRVLLPGH